MTRDAGRFFGLAEELARIFADAGIAEVAGDALEGYNPLHDVCRYLVNAAVGMARASGRSIVSYDFPLTGPPDVGADAPGALRIELGADELRAKETAALGYGELASEVSEALRRFGREAFRVECFRPVRDDRILPPELPPPYERYGEERVAAGRYERVLRFHEHVRPVAEALAQIARSGVRCVS